MEFGRCATIVHHSAHFIQKIVQPEKICVWLKMLPVVPETSEITFIVTKTSNTTEQLQ
jgi:hypothetical protein